MSDVLQEMIAAFRAGFAEVFVVDAESGTLRTTDADVANAEAFAAGYAAVAAMLGSGLETQMAASLSKYPAKMRVLRAYAYLVPAYEKSCALAEGRCEVLAPQK